MARSLLAQLNEITVTVADTGDIRSIERFRPREATTNPSLITSAAQMPEYADVVDRALDRAQGETKGTDTAVIAAAIDRLAVEFGLRILAIVPGRVSTEVDARLSFDTAATVEKGRSLIRQYEAAGATRERVLIKIASTWEGIRAAEILEGEGIHCNLTLLFGMHQAVACAAAGVTLISPFVGRILDWHKKQTGKDFAPAEDPGVLSVKRIYNYYKTFGYRTQVMGASFRNVAEILELAGCDLLTISPPLLEELERTTATLTRKLDPDAIREPPIERISLDEAAFRTMHDRDQMARDKLAEGIAGFSKAISMLEKLLGERIAVRCGRARAGQAARAYFQIYDLDGDGFITREEWGGLAEVFTALDRDCDGRISPEELARGLGAPFLLS